MRQPQQHLEHAHERAAGAALRGLVACMGRLGELHLRSSTYQSQYSFHANE